MNALETPRPPGRPQHSLTAGLVDLGFCALCIWAAWYHTPAGALLRSGGARLMGRQSSAAPLLSYYSSGVYETGLASAAPIPVAQEPIPPNELLGAGALEALRELPASQRIALRDVLAEASDPHPSWTAPQLAQRLHALSDELGSEDAGMVALFAGPEAVRFAAGRARANHQKPSLVELSRELPPRFADRVAMASRALSLAEVFHLAWPVDPGVRITSPFGMRMHPILGVQKMHTGVDLGVPLGTGVAAVDDGVVRRASEDPVNGRVLIIDHGRGVTTAYCHNQELLVGVGDRITRGEIISRSGSSGRSTGPHLHYQLEMAGVPVDPLGFRSGAPPAISLGEPPGD